METTLILLKPDCVLAKHCGEILARFEKAGFQIVGAKMMNLASATLREHYAHLLEKPFYPRIEAFMQSTPVVAVALRAENAVDKVREMLGPTDSSKAAKGTIRGDFGKDVQFNVVHASDSKENAEVELKRFFKSEELFEYDLNKKLN
jgi:nucleoside-diphosphate kinase